MLIPDDLASRLEEEWLGQFPGSNLESADLFAGAVSGWFAGAMALGFPCTTATARRPQLATLAALALSAGAGKASGAMLAGAVAAYYAGQNFGTGVAAVPIALPAGAGLCTAAFLDLGLEKRTRAGFFAQGCHVMAVSTLVTFAAPPAAAPVM